MPSGNAVETIPIKQARNKTADLGFMARVKACAGATQEKACFGGHTELPESAGPGGNPGSNEQGNFALARAIVEHWTSQARQAMVVRFLVPLCPSESLTSVAAIHCLVASCPEKGQARPRRRDCEAIANRAEPGKSKSKESMPWRNAKSPPSSGCRTGG